MNDLSGKTIKSYDLHELIGAGGFGAVYRAYQPAVKREVAIKIILAQYANHPGFIRRFEVEAQLVARLEHLHIVPLYDYWREPDGAYLVMRWLRGGSLRGLLTQGALELPLATRMLNQVASGLTAAHRNGVVHRDLKPDNVLLDEDQNAYLADFGIAKDLGDGGESEMVEEEYIVGSPSYLSPEQIRTDPVTPQTDIYSLGVILYEMLTGDIPFPGLPVSTLLFRHLNDPLPELHTVRPDLTPEINAVVQKATAKNPAERYADALAMAAAFQQAVGASTRLLPHDVEETTRLAVPFPKHLEEHTMMGVSQELIAPPNPYKGLRAFQEADAADFFGREALVTRLIGRLGETETNARFLAVVGPSGSGKSSVVRAGVIPALRRGALPGSDRWFVQEVVPGTHPLEEVEAALLRIAVNPPASLMDQLREDERGLARAVKRVLPGDDSELVLVIDQFEELFTMVEDEPVRGQVLDSLLAAASDPRSRIRLIVTLRADFYDRPLLYPAFGELMRQRTEVVLPMSAEELERAISAPAERVGLKLESGLAATIITDVGQQPGTLPLLEYSLSELYERRQGLTLTLDAYKESGRALGALGRRADELFASLDAGGQRAARQLFLRLIMPGEGVEDTRRRVRQTEIIAADDATMRAVIEAFGRYRLLTFDHDQATRTPTIEVAHEALIRQWDRLRGWIQTSREDVRLQRRLTAAAEEWLNASQELSFLLAGTRLEQFASWAAGTDLGLSQTERAYLDASVEQRQRQQSAEAARHAHEALLEQRSRQRLQALVVVLLVATLGALGLTGFALSQNQIAQQNAATATVAQGAALVEADNAATAAAVARRNEAEARSLAFASGAQLALSGNNTDLAIALALLANQVASPSPPTVRALADAAYAPGTRRVFAGHTDRVLSVALSPDGTQALSGSTDRTLILWDVATGQMIRTLAGHADWVRAVAFAADGQTAASGSSDQTVIVWNLETGEVIRRLEGHTGAVNAVTFAPDGTRLLSAAADRTLILWDIETGEIIRRLEGHTDEVLSAAISKTGFTALSGSRDRSIILWNLQSGAPLRTFTGHTGKVNDVAYSPDETSALSASEDHTLILWSFETGEPIRVYAGHTAQVHSAAFSPDGRLAVSSAEDNRVILWDVATGAERHIFLGHTQLVQSLAFAPDGRHVLSGSWDATLRLWDTGSGAETQRLSAHSGAAVLGAAFAPDGARALTVGGDGAIITWEPDSGQTAVWQAAGEGTGVNCAAFSLDSRLALTGADDALLTLWDVETGKPLRTFEGHSDAVLSVMFSPDGTRAVSGSKDNTVIVWDVTTGEQLQRFIGHTQRVTGVAFAPDGRTVLSSSFDTTLKLWDVERGELIRTFEGHADWVRGVVFAPDGQTALSGSADNTLILWDVTSGTRLRQFEGHTAQVLSLAISSDGRLAASGAGDTLVLVWDLGTGAEVSRFEGDEDAVNTVVFSPDGDQVLSGAGDGSVRLWHVATGIDDLLEWTRATRYIRELTCVEREHFRVEPLCPPPPPPLQPGDV